ncbi:methyl-accepting chemotaxis protein [Desulfovibrio sp. UCD-KL4C]|uniref:methyl-accepting chemotaxis protein n=1 Tax=Desulfovibrio sp. UCD-KL4C TaxID=2578120 RepID=UPI0025C17792|nr:methyl-accepting chemotaxis protein [Desulfovibrio sp. UCD-KL4C]
MNLKSINSRIAIIIAVVIFVSVAGFVVVVSHMTNSTVLSIQDQNMKVLKNNIVSEVEQFLKASENDLNNFAYNNEYRAAFSDNSSIAEVTKKLRRTIANYDDLTGIAAFDLRGKVVFGVNDNGNDVAGLDVSNRDYVKKVLNGASFVVSDVMQAKSSGKFVVVMAVPVRGDNGNIIGGFFTALNWQQYANMIIGNISIGDHGYAFIIDKKGRFIAHKTSQDLLKDMSSHQFIKDSLANSHGVIEYEWEGESKIQSVQVIPSTGWVVCVSAYKSDLAKAANEQRDILIGMGLVMMLLLIGIIVFAIRRQVTGPMNHIKNFTAEVAKGNFKAELLGTYVCELSDLAENIRHMVGELKNKLGFSEGVLNGLVLPCGIVSPDNKITWVNTEMCDLLESPVDPKKAVEMTSGEFFFGDKNKETLSQVAIREQRQVQREIEYTAFAGTKKNIMVSTTPFYDMDKNMLGSVAVWIDMTEIRIQQHKIEENNIMISEAAASATDVSNQVLSFSEELSAQVEQSSRGAEEQSSMASEAATAMEEMNSTVFEVARNASTAAGLADESQEKAREGEKMVSRTVETISMVRDQSVLLQEDMSELGKQADGIGNIMGVISDIADQTNLLALNAAIEAARAGEAGRGFAVVADEVRKLAEKTMTATSEVADYISSIQNSARKNINNTEKSTEAIGEVTDMVNNSGDILKEIVEKVAETADQVRSIATASEQQSAASEEISRSTSQINSIASETAQAMNESANAVSNLSKLAHELNSIIARMQG